MSSAASDDPYRFRWNEPFSSGDGHHHDGSSSAWTHHGIAISREGLVFTPHTQGSKILALDRDGTLVRSWPFDGVTAHGLTISGEKGAEVLWVADTGQQRARDVDGKYPLTGPYDPRRGMAIKYALDGEELLRLPIPDIPDYEQGDYCPTSIAVVPADDGESGDVWVADGYGENLVHRFDSTGAYCATIDGTRGAGAFNQPHAVYVETRGARPELFVADRANNRVQVFSTDGTFLRSFGEEFLISPSGFAAWGEELVIAELDGRLTVVDQDGGLVGYLGANAGRDRPGWPNAIDEQGAVIAPQLQEGLFNSPHGLAVDDDLNLYVTEFVVGGRLVKLSHFRQN